MASRGRVSHRRMFLIVSLVLAQVLEGQGLLRRELPLLDVVQAVGEAGVADVEIDVGFLFVDLVGRHAIALEQGRVGPAAQDGHAHQRGEAPEERTPAPETNRDETQDSYQTGQDHQRLQDRELGVDVGIPGAKDHPSLREEEIEHRQAVPRDLQKSRRAASTKRCPRARREIEMPVGEI